LPLNGVPKVMTHLTSSALPSPFRVHRCRRGSNRSAKPSGRIRRVASSRDRGMRLRRLHEVPS
jgi:hypothetical protein